MQWRHGRDRGRRGEDDAIDGHGPRDRPRSTATAARAGGVLPAPVRPAPSHRNRRRTDARRDVRATPGARRRGRRAADAEQPHVVVLAQTAPAGRPASPVHAAPARCGSTAPAADATPRACSGIPARVSSAGSLHDPGTSSPRGLAVRRRRLSRIGRSPPSAERRRQQVQIPPLSAPGSNVLGRRSSTALAMWRARGGLTAAAALSIGPSVQWSAAAHVPARGVERVPHVRLPAVRPAADETVLVLGATARPHRRRHRATPEPGIRPSARPHCRVEPCARRAPGVAR